jgi:hypothetical protein
MFRSFFNKAFISRSVRGVINANLPESGGAVAAYITYKDMPYAGSLALYQVAENAALNSAIGVLVPMVQHQLMASGQKKRSGGGQGSNKKNQGGKNGKAKSR